MNTVVLVGRCSKKNEIYYTQQNKVNIRINIVVRNEQKQDGEADYFFPCVIWGNSATFVNQYVEVGDLIAITGRLQTNKWTDAQGQPHSITEINVDKVEIVCKKNTNNNGNGANNVNANNNNQQQLMPSSVNQNVGFNQQPQQPNQTYQNNGNANYQNQGQPQYQNRPPMSNVAPAPYPQNNAIQPNNNVVNNVNNQYVPKQPTPPRQVFTIDVDSDDLSF